MNSIKVGVPKTANNLIVSYVSDQKLRNFILRIEIKDCCKESNGGSPIETKIMLLSKDGKRKTPNLMITHGRNIIQKEEGIFC
jgi:hypothetical protein